MRYSLFIQPRFRVATAEQAAYFTGLLYPLQDRIFAVAAAYDDSLILTGGTALARLSFGHRYSDDIYLFTLQPQAGRLGRDLGNALAHAGFLVEPIQAARDFFRAMISDGVTRMQLDVAPDSPRVVAPARSTLGVYVHDLRDIAADTISAYENRVEVKDAVDLLYLSRATTWNQMFADAEIKRIPIAYEDLQHFLRQPLSGEALLTREIGADEFDRFVDTLRTEISEEIKKKSWQQWIGSRSSALACSGTLRPRTATLTIARAPCSRGARKTCRCRSALRCSRRSAANANSRSSDR